MAWGFVAMTTTMAKLNFSISGALMTSPWWLEYVGYVSTMAQALAAVTGALIGIVTLYRLLTKPKA
jgi:hypothetical protein